MFEMSSPCDHHGQIMAGTICDRVVITDRATRLNEGLDTGFMSQLHTIIKGEECVTGHHRTVQVEFELLRFFNGLAE